jgi:hypothetical protein
MTPRLEALAGYVANLPAKTPAVAKPAPKRAPLSTGRSQTATAIRHRAEHLGLIFRKSHRRGPPIPDDQCGYRLLTASGEVVLGAHFNAALTDIASYLETRFAPAPANAQRPRARCAAGPSGSATR